MSGRHKPLMHVIFLFPPAIPPAFPHRSLLSPSHFKNEIYFCLRNHALSLLIQGVRLHWDSKHTSSLNKLGIHFSTTRRYLPANQVWLGVVTSGHSSGRIWRPWREVIDRHSLTAAKSKQYLNARALHSTEPFGDRAGPASHVSLDHILGQGVPMQSWLCLSLQSSVGSHLPSTECFLLRETRVKPQQTCLAVLFCFPSFLPDSLCMTSSTGSQGYFSHTTSFSPLQILSG